MGRLLTIKDAPMFQRVMKESDLCKGVLESILGIEIDHIKYQNTEDDIQPYIDSKGVRFDAYVKATGQVFDIEMQTAQRTSLGRRMRYYQSSLDSTLRDKGGSYDNLEESFVIFICTYDPYKRDLPIYHIDRSCAEDISIDIEDASHWIVLNSTAWQKDDDIPRANLLQFIQNGKVSDTLTENLASAVKTANDDVKWRKQAMGFMTLEHDMRAQISGARKEGLAEGKAESEERYSKLIDILLNEKRIDDLQRAADNADYRQSLFKEFGL